MKIEGAVVLYHPEDDILKNIETYINYVDKLYLIDNTPNVDSNDKYKKYKKIEYVPLKDNKGIAYALNYAAKLAIKDNASWLLTMDQDSSFYKDGLRKMIDFLKEMKKSKSLNEILGVNYDKIGVLSPYHITNKNQGNLGIIKGVDYPDEVMTSGNLINLEAYKKIKGFKEWLFIDCVDFDYCFNLKKHGYEVMVLNYVYLNHNLGDIIKIKFLGKEIYTDNHNATRWYYMSRNRKYIISLYSDIFPAFCKYQEKCTRREMLKIILFEKNKFSKISAIIKGSKDFKHNVKGKLIKK